jgi:hypothetical protein
MLFFCCTFRNKHFILPILFPLIPFSLNDTALLPSLYNSPLMKSLQHVWSGQGVSWSLQLHSGIVDFNNMVLSAYSHLQALLFGRDCKYCDNGCYFIWIVHADSMSTLLNNWLLNIFNVHFVFNQVMTFINTVWEGLSLNFRNPEK